MQKCIFLYFQLDCFWFWVQTDFPRPIEWVPCVWKKSLLPLSKVWGTLVQVLPFPIPPIPSLKSKRVFLHWSIDLIVINVAHLSFLFVAFLPQSPQYQQHLNIFPHAFLWQHQIVSPPRQHSNNGPCLMCFHSTSDRCAHGNN